MATGYLLLHSSSLKVNRYTSIFIVPWRFSFPRKYRQPQMQSKEFPGPQTLKEMNAVTPHTKDSASIQCFVKYKKCKGNYLCDVDNNVMLDLDAQMGSLALGYNDKQFIKALKKGKMDTFQIQNISQYLYPSIDLPAFIHKNIISEAAPKGLTRCLFAEGSGSNAVELAIKIALLHSNRPDSLIASFENSQHGSSYSVFAAGSVSQSRKKDDSILPSFDFGKLVLPFPQLKYPLEKNTSANIKEEERCLKEIKTILNKERHEKIAGLLVEPIQVKKY